jgi:tRNA (guanine26-N2/guanine27-N2)-dimethyltransferase
MSSTPSLTSRPVPEGFSPHTERNATILLPVQDKPFLNPIQEYNRDLSVAVIKHWSKVKDNELREKFEKKRSKVAANKEKQRGKGKGKQVGEQETVRNVEVEESEFARAGGGG